MQREADVFGFVRAGHVRKLQQNLAPRHVTPCHIGQPLGFLADDMFDHHVDGQIGQRGRDDMPTIPQDRRAVGDAGNFVHAVADIDDRHALCLQLPQKDEQPFHIRHRKRGRRFIQDQDTRILTDRLGNLGQLLLPRPQIAHQRGGIDLDLQHVKDRLRPPDGIRIVDHPPRIPRLARQEDVLRHGQRRDQRHFLKVHGNTRRPRRLGRAGGQFLATNLDLALLRHVNAVQDLEDGGLPRPVAAEQGVDFTGKHLEIHTVQRADAAEGFGNPRHPHGNRGGGGHSTRSHLPVSPDRSRASATSSVSRPSSKFGLGCLPLAIALNRSKHSTIFVSE